MNPETLVALIDIFRLVGLKPFKVTKKDVTKAISLEEDLNKFAKKIVKGDSIKLETNVKLSDAKPLIEAILNADPTHITQDFLSNDFSSIEIAAVIADTIKYLQTTIPEIEGQSLLARFIWKCRIVDNPLYILQLISSGQLTPLDVTALKEVYPDIYEATIQAFISNIIAEVKDINKLPRTLKMMLAMLLETPILNDTVVKAYMSSENIQPTNLNIEGKK